MSTTTSLRIPLGLLIGTGAVVFLANAGLLVLQLVAGRLLSPFIGSSIETWTSVIGVFLTGIALGNWLGGRIADRFPKPSTVAVLLMLGGLSSFGMIASFHWAHDSGFYRAIPLTPRIPLLALLFCLPPAVLFSLLTPVTIRLLLPDVGSAGRTAGMIFALSTLGCLIGNYCTGFWLMAEFELNEIIAGVGIGLFVLALPIFFLKAGDSAAAPAASEPLPSGDEPPEGGWNFRGDIRPAYGIVFIASFCGMSLELTGTRLLAPYLGVSLYTWTGVIGVMLAGTCCGNYLGGILADRGPGPAVRRFAFLIAALIGAAIGPILVHELLGLDDDGRGRFDHGARLFGGAVGVLGVLPGIWISKRRHGGMILSGFLGGLVGVALAHAAGRALDVAIPALSSFTDFHESLSARAGFDVGGLLIHSLGFVTGAAVALLFVWDAPGPSERTSRCSALSGSLFAAGMMTLSVLLLLGMLTRYSALIYAEDIVFKVLAWTFGLFFLPMLLLGTISPQVIRLSVPDVARAGRVAGNVYAFSTAGAIAGAFVTGYFLIASIGTYRVLMALAFLLTALAFLVGRLWKNNAMLYAASIVSGGAIFGLFIVDFGANRFERETKYYAIRVELGEYKGKRVATLTLDHLIHSEVNLDDPTWLYYDHEYIQAELVMLARSRHEQTNLLVIGGGGYTFPRYAELILPDVSNEVVEIDPGVTEVAYDKLTLPRDTAIQTINMDGRQFISERARKHHYQVVAQDAVNDYSVPAHLMTKEYNELIKATLTPDGAYLLTFIDSLQHGRFWRAAVNTLRQSFRHVYLLSPKSFDAEVEAHGRLIRKAVAREEREVYVIYASDEPLDLTALQRVVTQFIEKERKKRENVVAMVSPLATPLGQLIAPWVLRCYTHALDEDELERLLASQKRIILTDQKCPVDNLMSDVFRDSLKRTSE